MAEFHTVGRVGDLNDGEGMTVAVGTKLIAVFRTRTGRVLVKNTTSSVSGNGTDLSAV